mgnify:CR=1 FL=1
MKLVYGIGFNDRRYPTRLNGRDTKEYSLWAGMLERCTEKLCAKFPTYNGVACSENFKSYSYFYEWCKNQKGFSNIDEKGNCWQLDKDLLIKGNKLYSEDTCVFVPHRINALLTKCNASRGNFPIGMYFNKRNNKYKVRCGEGGGKTKYLGLFSTKEEAFITYKTFKEQLIKDVANDYKLLLDDRLYQALIDYNVSIND